MILLLSCNFIRIYLALLALARAINSLLYIRSLRCLVQGLALGLSYYQNQGDLETNYFMRSARDRYSQTPNILVSKLLFETGITDRCANLLAEIENFELRQRMGMKMRCGWYVFVPELSPSLLPS